MASKPGEDGQFHSKSKKRQRSRTRHCPRRAECKDWFTGRTALGSAASGARPVLGPLNVPMLLLAAGCPGSGWTNAREWLPRNEQYGGAEVAQSARGRTLLGFSSDHDQVPPGTHALALRGYGSTRGCCRGPHGWTVYARAVGAREPPACGLLSHAHASASARWPPRPAPQALLSGPSPPPRRGRACCLPCFQDGCVGLAPTHLRAGAAPGLRQLSASPDTGCGCAACPCRPGPRC